MKKYIAELFGTFVLVFIGCGTVVFSAPYVGFTGIALAFGLAVMAMIYAIGPISGAHINPAVTLQPSALPLWFICCRENSTATTLLKPA